jgi:glc operon protein GlcG
VLGHADLSQFPAISKVSTSRGLLIPRMLCFFLKRRPMKTKFFLEVADVKAIAAAAEAEALKNQWAVSIAIVDDGGHLLSFVRMDGAAPISSHIAPGKARTAAMGRRESKVYEDIINGGRVSFLSAPDLNAMLEGGVPIMKDGQCLGAVGVSGVKSPEDAQIAKAGIAALAL